MNKAIILAVLASALAGLSPQISPAQGTIYVSTLGLPSTGSASVGSDSWLAEFFQTGPNAGGYLLNSVQLALTDATGTPSGFTVMIYNRNPLVITGFAPGNSLGTLSGSLDPVAPGLYTYTPGSTLTLSPGTPYFIVLTAGTAVADGAYEWSVATTGSPTVSGGWNGGGISVSSSDGLNWRPSIPVLALSAISATAVPEPSTLGLLALGGFFLVRRRRKSHGG
jgi:hypothetical protein